MVHYSTEIKKDEKVLISYSGDMVDPLAKQIIREIYKVGGIPFVDRRSQSMLRELLLQGSEEQFSAMAHYDRTRMKDMDVFIGIRGDNNAVELSDVPSDKMDLYNKYYTLPVHFEERIPNTRWTVLRYPTTGMAQLSNMSTQGFEDFYFTVCNLDYSKMSEAMDHLVHLMEATDRVHIKGVGTDLSFSIKDIPVIKCDGKVNLPDGEVFTAPVKDSINGILSYNCPAEYQGFTFENIVLEFKEGKIIKATANDTERLNKVFDRDEGARYVGEFAIGVNPYILKPMKETLFDEKIMGSFHFTPGNAYDDAFNGNKSSIHWDLVCIQTPEYEGGEIYFDDVLIRKEGMFVIPELYCLNPENLK